MFESNTRSSCMSLRFYSYSIWPFCLLSLCIHYIYIYMWVYVVRFVVFHDLFVHNNCPSKIIGYNPGTNIGLSVVGLVYIRLYFVLWKKAMSSELSSFSLFFIVLNNVIVGVMGKIHNHFMLTEYFRKLLRITAIMFWYDGSVVFILSIFL